MRKKALTHLHPTPQGKGTLENLAHEGEGHKADLLVRVSLRAEKSLQRVRPALPEDLPALLDLESSFFSDRLFRRNFRHLILNGNADVLVFDKGNKKITGNVVILYRRNSARARLYSLVVHPQHQRRGIARALMKAAEDAAESRGCQSLSLEVRPDNEAASRLYQKIGYTLIKRVDDYYQDHTPALRMIKLIGMPKMTT